MARRCSTSLRFTDNSPIRTDANKLPLVAVLLEYDVSKRCILEMRFMLHYERQKTRCPITYERRRLSRRSHQDVNLDPNDNNAVAASAK
jgi:hypothetical protein